MIARHVALRALVFGVVLAVNPMAFATELPTVDAASRDATNRSESLVATPPAPTDSRGFEAGDQVTFRREGNGYERYSTYEYSGNDQWLLLTNDLKQKSKLATKTSPQSNR